MSIPAQAPADGIVHPTRQQLDELDALIKRMLTIPVDAAGDGLDPSAPADPEAAAREAAERARTRQESSGALSASRQAASEATEEGELSGDFCEAGTEEAHAIAVWSDATGRPESTAAGADVFTARLGAAPGASRPESRRRWLAAAVVSPLVWSNAAFDGCTTWLGPAGSWLRGAWGRAVVGWTGLALLATAVAWGIAGWIGWTW